MAAPLHARCRWMLVPHETLRPAGAARTSGSSPRRPASTRSTRATSSSSRACPGAWCGPLGVDLERPFCLQVLELDRWDDPHAAIEAFRVARAEEPELQLVLAALLDAADSGGWQAAKEVSDYVAGERRRPAR